MGVSGGPKAPRLRKRHVPKYYEMPRSGNMTSFSVKKREKFLGLLRLSKTEFHRVNYIFSFPVTLRPNADYDFFILEVSRSYKTTHHTRHGSCIPVITSSQRPLPDNTQHSQQKNIHAPGGIQNNSPSRRAATDTRQTARPLGPAVNLILAIIY